MSVIVSLPSDGVIVQSTSYLLSHDVAKGAALSLTASPVLQRVLASLGVSWEQYWRACEQALLNGSDAARELVAARVVGEETLGRAMADALGLPFSAPEPQDQIIEGPPGSERRHLRTCTPALEAKLFIWPRLEALDDVAAWFARAQGGSVLVATPRALDAHRARFTDRQRHHDARFALASARPDLSARTVFSSGQAFGFGFLTLAFLLLLAAYGLEALRPFHIALSVFFAAFTLFRFAVLLDHAREERRRAAERADREAALVLPPAEPLPTYTVLVALHHEAEMVSPLVDALTALNWPRALLDIKLICEADDPHTIAAVEARIAQEPGIELVLVPPSLPRTKPKALNHALPLACGDLVVLYDAEDRPDPDQLLEAWLTFRSADASLACLQAPLTIRNGGDNWFAGLFALEYAVLFRATLPFLARRDLPIPLGGTSNHFRREALEAVGGWDGFNVAEDADLGVRLCRHGYRTGVLTAATCEAAPTSWRVWRNQRTRWLKGWMQTWLVHMRRPRRLVEDLGLRRAAAFYFLFVSMIAGGVMHTVFVAHLFLTFAALASGAAVQVAADWLAILDLSNIVFSWIAFALLAGAVVSPREAPLLIRLPTLWAYWGLVSYACVRAGVQLLWRPHLWEKTPHHE
ncbi:glycosyltransferase [Aureimonas mangrovi]|uniref:glycosyltransferase n=1 Tax=Aureimonas mangrovi TaxID=2758041 RepID=UPI001AEEF903|nr:glycosyltransferase [Aureimonas mangrovi]